MSLEEKIIRRFEELTDKGEKVLDTKYSVTIKTYPPSVRNYVDVELSNEWGMGCLNILSKATGNKSDYYQSFKELLSNLVSYSSIKKALGILKAAKDDYENGYLFDTRTLIEAEVFSDILEQAEELLKKGHYQASAVIAGCILEDGLRKLCDKNSVTFSKKPTIEPMNVELAKIGIYNQFIKDKVSSIGKLRNHAAHGEWNEFEKKDVEDMIRDVRRFMEDYFS
jgi:hypothetical protein